MRTVWKYSLPILTGPHHVLKIPGANIKVVSVAGQHGIPSLWIGVSTDERAEDWSFQWAGTGADHAAEGIPAFAVYAGTLLLHEGDLVLHGFLWQRGALMSEKWNKPGQHFCWIRSAEKGYGDAIDDCAEDDQGRFWASNGEYGSQVNFCPVCGAKAPTPVAADKYQSDPVPSEKPSAERSYIRIWHFHDAPSELKELSGFGGDEDWLAHIPADLVNGHYYGWMESGSAFGICDVAVYDLPDGSQVRIGAHS